MEFAIGIAILVFLYKSREITSTWISAKSDELHEIVLESEVERQSETFALGTKIDKIKETQGGKWLKADDLRSKMES